MKTNETIAEEVTDVGVVVLTLTSRPDNRIRVTEQSDMEDKDIIQVYLTWTQSLAKQAMSCNPPQLNALLAEFAGRLQRMDDEFRKAEKPTQS